MNNMYALTIDKEFEELIPPLSPDEFEQLEQNIIKNNGCRDDLVVWYIRDEDRTVIIDGHNRFKICNKHNINIKYGFHNFDSREEAKIWIIENQLGRRNLPDGARINLALERKQMLQQKAKENQKLSQGKGAKGLTKSANLNEPVKPINTRKEVAKMAGTSEDSVSKFEKIKKEGTPELVNDVVTGQKKINTAYKEIRSETVKQEPDIQESDVINVDFVEVVENTTSFDKQLQKELIEIFDSFEQIQNIISNLKEIIYKFEYSNDEAEHLKTKILNCNVGLNGLKNYILESSSIEPSPPTDELVPGTTELDSPEVREKLFIDNKEQWFLSKIYVAENNKQQVELWKKIEKDLGVCDNNNKLLLSYDNYIEIVLELKCDLSNLDRLKTRVAKMIKNMEGTRST